MSKTTTGAGFGVMAAAVFVFAAGGLRAQESLTDVVDREVSRAPAESVPELRAQVIRLQTLLKSVSDAFQKSAKVATAGARSAVAFPAKAATTPAGAAKPAGNHMNVAPPKPAAGRSRSAAQPLRSAKSFQQRLPQIRNQRSYRRRG